jgi:hypothetical protein
MIAPQQAPEWLRPLLLILPVSRLRPIDKTVSVDSKNNGKLDTSGEENGGDRGGYGSQFRSRQLCFQNPNLATEIMVSSNYNKRHSSLAVLICFSEHRFLVHIGSSRDTGEVPVTFIFNR